MLAPEERRFLGKIREEMLHDLSGRVLEIGAGTGHGVYVSTDSGRTWSKTALDDTWIIAVGVDPANPDTVLAINRNGQLYRSQDGGLTWE